MGMILNTARTAARDGVLSTREVGQLVSTALENGKLTRGEISDLKKVQTELQAELSPAARRALRNFLSLGSDFAPNLAGNIFGLTNEDADKLENANIRTATDLLVNNRTSADRARTAGQAGLSEVLVTSLVEQADLARTVGVGTKSAAILQRIGINDVQELAGQNAVALRRQVTSYLNTTEGKAISSRRPSLKTIKKWIASAKTLPRMVRHQGDIGGDFNKTHFDALKVGEKAMLLFGNDVFVAGGAIFDASDLDVSLVQRRTSELKDQMDELIDEGFGGQFTNVDVAVTERIKLGDEVIGYRATFDVSGDASFDSEMAGSGGSREMGTVDVAFDADGEVLDLNYFVDYVDFDHE